MALSDEDRAAMLRLRAARDEMAPSLRGDLDRVLKLAGEEPEEPADLTFWFDPEDREVYMRDDGAVYSENNLLRWWATSTSENFSWPAVCRRAPVLVELVRKDSTAAKSRTILYELASAWQAWHYNACGRSDQLYICTYHECRQRWSALIGYGLDPEEDLF